MPDPNRRALKAAAEAISDLLTQLGVDPDDRGDQGDDGSGHYPPYSEDVKTIIARAAIEAFLKAKRGLTDAV
jgi:ribose 5-phosphate isomerase RpiB